MTSETQPTCNCDSKPSWIKDRIRPDEISRYMDGGADFIPDAEIHEKLKRNAVTDPGRIRAILDKSLAIETLSPDETAALLWVNDPELLGLMRQRALEVKKKVYDNRIVTFAPLYMGNRCVNNCLYCGFRRDNKDAIRRVLSTDEIRQETQILAGKIGHKRLIAVYGEHPETGVDYMVNSIRTIYSVREKVRVGWGNIRRVNVNAAPMPVDELKLLKDVGIGTYQVFQETYHKEAYAKAHPAGTLKGDYRWRLYSMHRALEAGIDDVGIGALFGLYDWRFEVMGLQYHALELEKRFNVGPHTVSFPRLEPASNAPMADKTGYEVSDDELKHIITVIRLSIPHAGMILTARENPDLRRDAIRLGLTQTDASTQIGIGAYSSADPDLQEKEKQQFILGDTRSLDEVIRELATMGYITSFCTAGYRCGRTGECIMDLLKSGAEGKFCKLNAVLTFREWLDDFASDATRAAGEPLIERELQDTRNKITPAAFDKLMEYYRRTAAGERDLYF
ncbi:MAG: [FeFe] hydrogenase H-cluster radical SAM maturase HydG [Candidatus Omnitrophica bacterium]|nr:[FeFe] hydrogenase H-cluster radical SAM maturase HydG [Candidatus Omnitrophota bacterium]